MRLNSQNGIISLVFLVLIFGVLAREAYGSQRDRVKFPTEVVKDGYSFKLQGTGYKRFLFMRAFEAGFYITEDAAKGDILSDIPKYLEVEYYLGIPAKSLSDFTISSMRLNISKKEFFQLHEEIDLMRRYFVDLKPSDRFSLTYLPGAGTQFAHNGKLTGTIPGEAFGRALFSVWVGEKPFDPVLKRKILGKALSE